MLTSLFVVITVPRYINSSLYEARLYSTRDIFRLTLSYRQTYFRRIPFDNTKRCGDISHRVSNDGNVVGVHKTLDTLVENSGNTLLKNF